MSNAYIAFLRSVNVGQNTLKMQRVRELWADIGFKNVRTYVQSGNVVFRTKQRSPERLGKGIEDAIEEEAGFRAGVVLRSTAEMREVMANNPFAKRKDIEPGKLLVNFLAADSGKQAREKALAIKIGPEEMHLIGREAYIYFPNGQGRSKFPWPAIERALETSWTGRNWNSVTKMLAMAEKVELPG